MSQKDREDDTSENVCHRKIERMILVKMYVEIFTTDVIVFISEIKMCLMSH